MPARRRRQPPATQPAEALDTRPYAPRIELILPFPPSANNAYPTVLVHGKPRRVMSSAAKKYVEAVLKTLELWLRTRGVRGVLPPFKLTLHVYPPLDGYRHDASNCIKLPEDALMKGIGGDDNDVEEVHVYKHKPDGFERLVAVLEGSE